MLVEGLIPCVQCDLRVDAPNAGANASTSSADGLYSPAFPEVSAKSHAEADNGCELFAVQVRIDAKSSAVGLPFAPFFLLSIRSCLHLFIGNSRISSSEITFELTSSVRQKPVQEFCKGNGKAALKKVRKSSSCSKCHLVLNPNDLNGISPRKFQSPAMCCVIKDGAQF